MVNYWLLKTDAESYSVDDFERDGKTLWTGVRNFQARNFLRDMKVGDKALFYHSSSVPTGVFGIAKISAAGIADPTAFDEKDEHFDPKSTKENPIWISPEIEFVSKLKAPLTLEDMKKDKRLADMRLLQRGNRLSVMPVTKEEFEIISKK